MKATYYYLQFRYDKEPLPIAVPVEIVGETKKMYNIRLLVSNVRGHKYGDVIKVFKDSVETPKEPVDCSDAWYHN